jgi:hypothetical protein
MAPATSEVVFTAQASTSIGVTQLLIESWPEQREVWSRPENVLYYYLIVLSNQTQLAKGVGGCR